VRERNYKREYAVRDHKYERKEPYAEDSTKGNSLINPLNYKGDVLVQVWIDSRVLATLCRWLDKNDCYSRFMSQVVRRPLEVIADMLVSSGDVEIVDDTIEARKMLERRFNVDLNRGGRGEKNVMHNIELGNRREELNERVSRENRFNDAGRPKRRYSPLVNEVIEKYNSIHGEQNAGHSNSVSTNDMSKNIIPTNEIVIKEKMTSEELREKERELEEKNKADNELMDEILGINRRE
jgi:hypothetical protein